MIWIYDKSIAGCCGHNKPVRDLVATLEQGTYRLRNTKAWRGQPRGNASLIYTNDETIEAEAGDVPVKRIPGSKRRKTKTTEVSNGGNAD